MIFVEAPSLYTVIPLTLFRPLAAPGAEVYADILLSLFAESSRQQQPLSRELAFDTVYTVLSNPRALDLTADAVTEEAASAETGDDALGHRASAVLRYLEQCGWLRAEAQGDFSQAYILPDYAFRLLRTLSEIAANEPPPLRGLICAIHDILQATVREGNADVRLPEAHRNTMLLINGLRELQHNIGLHITQLLNQYSARDVLRQVFTDYRGEIVDRVYHQLRTTDHVSRFRPGVLDAAAQLERAEQLETAARRLYQRREFPSIESGAAYLQEQLREVREQFEALDQLLGAIDTRHSQFVDAAVRKVELQLSADSTSSGRLNAILTRLLDEQDPLDTQYAGELCERLLNSFAFTLVDQQSLATPTRAPTVFNPEAVSAPVLTEAETEAARDDTVRQLARAISRERVRRYALQLLRGRDRIAGAEIALSGPAELALLIYLRTYGDGSLGYRVVEPEGAAWIERDGVGFRDFVLVAQPAEAVA